MKKKPEAELINWEKKFNTGIYRIDFEHKIFLELVNSLQFAMDEGKSEEELYRIITELEKYAVFHFISEENLMLSLQYPEYKFHQALHFDLLEQFNIVKHDHLDFHRFHAFLRDWFINHTVEEDIKIRQYMVSQQMDLNDHFYKISIS
jgi:hemerythrin